MTKFTCFVRPDGEQYSSLCLELDVASCGDSEDQAIQGLHDAVETYIEFMIDEGLEGEMYRPVPLDQLHDFLFPEGN